MRDRKSVRLRHYDYRSTGAYFVTICSYQRACIFEDERLRRIVEHAWWSVMASRMSRREWDFIVMPNHLHGIVWINSGAKGDVIPRGALAGSLGAKVGAFKALSARRINRERGTPGAPVWQRNYYEHVVRTERDLERAREYIADNPRKWLDDPNHPRNGRRAASRGVGASHPNSQ
jgi:REP element-mobilizing transposase RayT